MKHMNWSVQIEEVDNGYQVQVGCVKLVFERQETLLAELMAYMNGKKTVISERIKGEKVPVGQGMATTAMRPEPCHPSDF